jgi:hypothetical protein
LGWNIGERFFWFVRLKSKVCNVITYLFPFSNGNVRGTHRWYWTGGGGASWWVLWEVFLIRWNLRWTVPYQMGFTSENLITNTAAVVLLWIWVHLFYKRYTQKGPINWLRLKVNFVVHYLLHTSACDSAIL